MRICYSKFPSIGDSVKQLWAHLNILLWGVFHSQKITGAIITRKMCQIKTRATHYKTVRTLLFSIQYWGQYWKKKQTNKTRVTTSLKNKNHHSVNTRLCSTSLWIKNLIWLRICYNLTVYMAGSTQPKQATCMTRLKLKLWIKCLLVHKMPHSKTQHLSADTASYHVTFPSIWGFAWQCCALTDTLSRKKDRCWVRHISVPRQWCGGGVPGRGVSVQHNCWDYRQPFVPTSPVMTSTPAPLQHLEVQSRLFVYIQGRFLLTFFTGGGILMPVHHLSDSSPLTHKTNNDGLCSCRRSTSSTVPE